MWIKNQWDRPPSKIYNSKMIIKLETSVICILECFQTMRNYLKQPTNQQTAIKQKWNLELEDTVKMKYGYP